MNNREMKHYPYKTPQGVLSCMTMIHFCNIVITAAETLANYAKLKVFKQYSVHKLCFFSQRLHTN